MPKGHYDRTRTKSTRKVNTQPKKNSVVKTSPDITYGYMLSNEYQKEIIDGLRDELSTRFHKVVIPHLEKWIDDKCDDKSTVERDIKKGLFEYVTGNEGSSKLIPLSGNRMKMEVGLFSIVRWLRDQMVDMNTRKDNIVITYKSTNVPEDVCVEVENRNRELLSVPELSKSQDQTVDSILGPIPDNELMVVE